MSMSTERLPPHNIEAEEAVLGALLIDAEAISRVASFLRPDAFYREKNAWIYQALLDLHDRHEPGDFLTVCDALRRQGHLEAVGGPVYITALINAVPTSVNVEYYARIVERTAILRRLIDAAGQIAAIGYEESVDVDSALDRAEAALFSVSQRRVIQDFIPISVALREYFDQIDFLHEHKGRVTGIPTGFVDLDVLLSGLHPSDLIIVAGRPSVGKTAFALDIAHHAAVHERRAIAVFSLEMSVEQLVQRLLCAEAKVDSQRLRTGYIDDEEWKRVTEAYATLSDAPIFVDDTANISILELRTKARRLKAEYNIDLIIVDYLQLMRGRGLENRVQEVSEISRGLKGLAREMDVPVIALSQLSRAIESRSPHTPMLSDLRESGSIEQDADVVMFVHREELYDPKTEKKNIADIIVAKHRNGPIGTIPLRFFAAQTRFADLASKSFDDLE